MSWPSMISRCSPEERSLLLENLLWKQSKQILHNAQEIAWKSSFIAASLRQIRDPNFCTQAKQSPIRWIFAVKVINKIVNGPWSSWGPKAALVYEALAVKNYNLSRIGKRSESIKENVIHRVIAKLEKSLPEVSFDTYPFHPAGCISCALNIEHVTKIIFEWKAGACLTFP